MPENIQKANNEKYEDCLKINMKIYVENMRMVIKIMMKMRKDES
jgi:hypothetical protein